MAVGWSPAGEYFDVTIKFGCFFIGEIIAKWG